MRQRIQLPETSARMGVKHRGRGVKHPTESRQCSLLAHPQETWLLASDRRRRPQDARLNVSRVSKNEAYHGVRGEPFERKLERLGWETSHSLQAP